MNEPNLSTHAATKEPPGPALRPRRSAVRSVLFAVSFVLVSSIALAGSYLDRAALIVHQATDEAEYLRARLGNRELAEVVQKLADARLRAAREMPVPKEVVQAHPHLLLILENYERAASAAVEGGSQRFFVYQQRARDEEQVLRGVLQQLGWPLPK